MFTEREPLNDEIVEMLDVKPAILDREMITQQVRDEVMELVDVFMTGMPESNEYNTADSVYSVSG